MPSTSGGRGQRAHHRTGIPRRREPLRHGSLLHQRGALAVFASSFGAVKTSEYSLIGTKGRLRLSPAYDYSVPLAYELVIGDRKPKSKRKKVAKHDQFGAELEYFSDCI